MPVFKRPGPDKAIKKHILGLLSFDKNKGFTLESGHFVPSCKMHHKREHEEKIDLETHNKMLDGLASPEKKTEAKDLLLRTGSMIWRSWHFVNRWIGEEKEARQGPQESEFEEEEEQEDLEMSEFETCVDLNMCQFKVSDMLFVLLRTETTSYFDRSGTLVLCAKQLDKPPQLLFSAGTGFSFGGGFGGEAVEVEANICDVLKAAGVEGKLTPSEFLAVLLSTTALEHWQHDLEELADHEDVWFKELNDKRTTPILQDACRIAKPQPVLGTYDAKEEGKFESESKIMSVNRAPCRTCPKASTPDKMAQDKDVAPAKGKRSHCLSRAPTPNLVEVSSPTADVQGLVDEDHIDVTTAQPSDYGILDQQGDGESSSGGLLYQRKKRRKPSPRKDIGESTKGALRCDLTSAHDGIVRFKSGKGVTFETEDVDAAEAVFGPRLLRDLKKAASASSPSEEERHEENEVTLFSLKDKGIYFCKPSSPLHPRSLQPPHNLPQGLTTSGCQDLSFVLEYCVPKGLSLSALLSKAEEG